jgi:hypothetical protein
VDSGVNVGIGIAVGVFIFFCFAIASFAVRHDQSMSFKEWFEVVSLAGTRNLRKTFKLETPTWWETILHITTFDIMLKYFCFPTFLGLFVNQAVNDRINFKKGYGDYPLWVHLIAVFLILGALFFFLTVFVVWPEFWDGIAGAESVEEKKRISNPMFNVCPHVFRFACV